ncbi:MAG: DegV family protein [Leptolinea sp.]
MPCSGDFSRAYSELEREFKSILVLSISEMILPLAKTAMLAAQSHGGTARISVLDTLQIDSGLGILTQLAARKAAAGISLSELEEYIRAIIPFMFTIICPNRITTNDLTQNQHINDLSNALMVYSLEEGSLTPYKKVRTQRHLLETLQEFLGEFEKPQHLTYFHGRNASLHTRPLREAAGDMFPGVHFDDLELNEAFTTLFGENTVGLTVVEVPSSGGI